jgi:hypothetical protein
MSRQILDAAKPYVFDVPIPGQSLTHSPDEAYPWEGPPEITSQREGIQRLFLEIIKPDNMETLVNMMSNDIPLANIAELLIKTSFQKGKINADLAITLLEPTMFMLKSVDENEDIQSNLDLSNKIRTNQPIGQSVNKLQDLQRVASNIPLTSPKLKEQLDNLDVSKVKASILQRQKNERNPNASLLSKEET